MINPNNPLTKAQNLVMVMVAEGYTDSDISKRIHRSIKTIQKHRSDALRRLRAHNTAHAISLMYKQRYWPVLGLNYEYEKKRVF